jgi:hypothetical protein
MNIKNYIAYFYFILFFCLFGLFFYKNFNNINHFPNSYTHTDWLIHYFDGYIRRGLLGYLVIKFEEISKIDAKYIIFIIQIIAYTVYLFFIFKFFKNFKFNFFLLTFLSFPLFIIYPLYENEVLGRKEIFFILSFQFFLIQINNLKKLGCFFILLFLILINTFIHEAIIFYSFFFINIFLFHYDFNRKEKQIYLISFLTFISLIIIFNLFFNNLETLNLMTNNLNLKYNLSHGSGAISWLKKDIFEQLIIFNSNLSTSNILRFFIVLLISLFPFCLFFYNNKKKFNYNFFIKNLSINLFFLFVLIFIAMDWYRFFYIFFNFFVFSTLYQTKKDHEFINNFFINIKKIIKNNYLFILYIFIFFYSWSPKLLFSDDIGSFPILRIVSKLF